LVKSLWRIPIAIFGQALCELLHRDQRRSDFEGTSPVVIGVSPGQRRMGSG
jgi:hypothetical protein